jgi:hypothetical protein
MPIRQEFTLGPLKFDVPLPRRGLKQVVITNEPEKSYSGEKPNTVYQLTVASPSSISLSTYGGTTTETVTEEAINGLDIRPLGAVFGTTSRIRRIVYKK